MTVATSIPVHSLAVSAYAVPTETPEADGTFAWDSTTIVVVEVSAGDTTGLGYTYGPSACAQLISELLQQKVMGCDPMEIRPAWDAMVRGVRNVGRPGIASMAISAVDLALWDLKARLLGQPLHHVLGRVHSAVPVYGSGG